MECVIFVTLLVQHFLADISKHEKGTCWYVVYVKYYDSKKGIYAHMVRQNAGGVRRGNIRQLEHSISHVVHRLPTYMIQNYTNDHILSN